MKKPQDPTKKHRIFTTSFASVYPLYVQKAERKGREKQEVDQVICWLTGYSPKALADQIKRAKDFETSLTKRLPSTQMSARSQV